MKWKNLNHFEKMDENAQKSLSAFEGAHRPQQAALVLCVSFEYGLSSHLSVWLLGISDEGRHSLNNQLFDKVHSAHNERADANMACVYAYLMN